MLHVRQPAPMIRITDPHAVVDDLEDDVLPHRHRHGARRRLGVTGRVRQGLPSHGEELDGDLFADHAVDRSVEAHSRDEAQGALRLRGQLQHLGSQAVSGRSPVGQAEDRDPDLPDGLVEVGDHLLDPARPLHGLGPRRDPGEFQSGGEDPADHQVVEVAGDAVPVPQHLLVDADRLELLLGPDLRVTSSTVWMM